MRVLSQSFKASALLLSLGCVGTAAYGHGDCVHHASGGSGTAAASSSLVIPTLDLIANGMPVLNSNPNSIGSIYLDFDGGIWRSDNYLDPYDTDGDDTTYNASEQSDIYKAWLDVSTHFAMFDINVTTIAPDKTLTPTAHVLISNGMNGGAASSNKFGDTRSKASGAVSSNFGRNRSTGITHEVGHIMGLAHQAEFDEQGNLVRQYRSVDEWNIAPIMGVDYHGKFSSWQNGVRRKSDGSGGYYPVPQNDVEKMTEIIINEYNEFTGGTYTGDGFRIDDHGATRNTGATFIGGNPQDTMAEGVIERYDDIDGFMFRWFGGDFHAFAEAERNVAADPEFASSLGMNLHLAPRKGAGDTAEDLSSDPADTDAEIFFSDLAPDWYVLQVSSAGDVDDLGAYNLWVNPAQAAAAASLEFTAVPEPGSLALLGLGGLCILRRRRA